MTVTVDSGSLRYVPATAAEWTELLTGTGLANPSSWWLCNETSGTLTDSGSGGRTITLSGAFTYGATATGWTRTGIKATADEGATYGSCTIPNVNANSALLLQMFSLNTIPVSGSRVLADLETSGLFYTYIQLGGNLISRVGGSVIIGDTVQAGTVVVVTKLDRSRSEFATYTQNEKVTPTWAAPGSDTTMRILGDGVSSGTDATLVYQAFWTGTDAEMSDAQVQALLDAVDGDATTYDALQAGRPNYKTVIAIEGCDYLLSDAPSAAVLEAWHGRDFTSVLGGMTVNIQNSQSIQPNAAFTTHGRCTIRVIDETGEDILGEMMHKRLVGGETVLTDTIDNNDTVIPVASTQNFTSSGVAYIGTEAIRYLGVTATSLTGCTRGYRSPFGTYNGSGGLRFGNFHRVGPDADDVQLQPIVSQLPRVWLGRRVGVWLHVWDEEEQRLNHRREAQLVYAGHISAIGDDPNTMATVIELEHASKKLENVILGQDLWQATLADGLYIPEGRVFKFDDAYATASADGTGTANDLTVVAGAPASANEMQAGYYKVDEICGVISNWLAAEKTAARILGYYRMSSPVTSPDGPRTKMYWKLETGSTGGAYWHIQMPGEVAAFLGCGDAGPSEVGQSVTWGDADKTNRDNLRQGEKAPMDLLIFKASGPGRLSQEFSESTTYEAENEQGEFFNQYSLLPASIKASCDSSLEWGLFLLDERTLLVASYDDTTGTLRNCWLAPAQFQPADKETAALNYIGHRVDEPERGPVTLRQVLIIDGTWADIIKTLVYSTGTTGYNHPTYDTLGYRGASCMPGELFGDEFDRSVDNMPGAQIPYSITIEEPTRLTDLLSGDLLLRATFMRWKDQHFELCQWRTPTIAAATAELTEANKAAPANEERPEFRCSSIITNEYARPVTKFDFARDFVTGRNDSQTKSIQVKDRTQVDDLGGSARPTTIKLRNTYSGSAATGGAIESLLADYIATVAMFRPAMSIERSMDQTNFETIAPGDIVLVSDAFARDPLTGERGIDERPGYVVSTSYTMGGFTLSGKDFQSGRVEIAFLDVQRGEAFAPAGELDETANAGGFTAGYNNGTSTIRLKEHAYSSDGIVITARGRHRHIEENADATHFNDDDDILIIEIDPDDPAAPDYWERKIATVSGNDLTLTVGLSSPAFDSAKLYRVVPRKYSEVEGSQQNAAFMADYADSLIEDTDPPYHYGLAAEPTSFTDVTGSEPSEYVPEMSYGDGRPYDCGFERVLCHNANNYYDYKSAHQSPFLWNTIAQANLLGSSPSDGWNTLFAGPIFLGMDFHAGSIPRFLTVAPFWRSNDGNDSYLRITISRVPPRTEVAGATGTGGFAFADAVFPAEFSSSAVYGPTTSTTWVTGADAQLNLNVKGLHDGIVWLVIEGTGRADCRGLAKCIEGPRAVL